MTGFTQKKHLWVILPFLITALLFTLLIHAVDTGKSEKIDERIFQNNGQKEAPEYVEGEVLVKFKQGVSISEVNSIASSFSLNVERHYSAISRIKDHVYVHMKSDMKSTEQLLQELRKHPDVEDVSPNYRLRAVETIPNDPRFDDLWGLHNTGTGGGTTDMDIDAAETMGTGDQNLWGLNSIGQVEATVDIDIDAPEAWDTNTGSSGVIVAVIDTGIDYSHPDLAPNIWSNPNEIVDGVDNDGNGFIDDIHGINAITMSGNPMDDNGHGTHCAGTIGAVGNNGLGVAGVNWNVKMLGAKFLAASGSGATSDSITCIDYIVDLKTNYGQNIVAINASYGGGGFSQSIEDAIDAAGDAGILFCAAAGNNWTDNDTYPHYPSSYESSSIIAVTAVNVYGTQWYNYGAVSVDLGAPGISILSTTPCVYSPQPGDIFFDDMESGAGNWTTGGVNNTWAITTDQEGFDNASFPVPSPPNFWSDSPGADYAADTDSWLMVANDIDLSSYAGQPVYIGFGSAMNIEDYFDHAYVEVSGDSGSTWTPVMDFTGYGYYWKTGYSYVVPDAVKTANFRFRFHLITDYSVEYWGWLIDDVGIGTDTTCGYAYKSGTSMATPHVTGAVALMAAQHPTETTAQRKARILGTVVPLPSLYGVCVTGGLLNLDLAINAVRSLTVTSPNSGEDWKIGYPYNITWDQSIVAESLKITLWKDGILVGVIASDIPPTDGAYAWTAGQYSGGTAAPGTGYTIKIKEKGTTVADVSDLPFTLSPSILVTSPNGGESWLAGSTHDITWDAHAVSETVKISLCKDGVLLGTIASNLPAGSGSYSWTVGQYSGGTATPGTGYTIKIKEKGTVVTDYSDAPFTIASLTLTSPNGGENWQLASSQNITWDAVGITGDLKITLWKDGALLGVIADNIDISTGSYAWNAGLYGGGTAAAGTGYTIKIKKKGDVAADVSDLAFTLSPSISVTSPNGGESWQINTTENITWDALSVTGTLKITLWKDGVLMGVIADNLSAVPGSYAWTVGQYGGGTASSGTGYTIKIKEKGTTVVDTSDASFSMND